MDFERFLSEPEWEGNGNYKGRMEDKDIEGYISRIVNDYLSKEDIELNGEALKKDGEQKAIFNQAKRLFAYQSTKDVMAIISKENQPNYAETK